MKQNAVILDKFWIGEGQSKNEGFDATSNLDAHTEIGTVRCQYALTEDSTTPNEACVQATASDGTVYFFSTSSGKTWKRTTGGTYSLVNTNANGAHINAYYSSSLDKIIYCTSGKVGHLVASTDTFTDSFGTFSNGSSYHPIVEVNTNVFIGDGKYVASISSALSFAANALDIPAKESITALENYNHYLIIGTIVSTNVHRCMIYIWDTYSSSWSFDDVVYAPGINCFIPADNMMYLQAGLNGDIYVMSGNNAVFYFNVRNVTTSVKAQMVTVLKRRPLIALGTKVYSLFHAKRGVEDAIIAEYTANTTINSIGVSGTKLLVHAGTKTEKIGSSYGTATITTPVIKGSQNTVFVNYESLPSGTTLGLETNINGNGWVSETKFVNDTNEMRYVLQDGATFEGKIKFAQYRVSLNGSGASTPIIQSIEIL